MGCEFIQNMALLALDCTTDISYILHMVEAKRGATARVFKGFSGEGLIVTVDETEISQRDKKLNLNI